MSDRAHHLPQHPGREKFRAALVRADHQQLGRPLLPVRAALRDPRHQAGHWTRARTARSVTFCAMLPGLLLAPLYGWIVDRYLAPLGHVLCRPRPRRRSRSRALFLVPGAQPRRRLRRRVSHGRVQRPFHSRRGRRRCRRSSRPRAADHRQFAHLAHRRHRQFRRHPGRQLHRLDLRRAQQLSLQLARLSRLGLVHLPHLRSDLSPDRFSASSRRTGRGRHLARRAGRLARPARAAGTRRAGAGQLRLLVHQRDGARSPSCSRSSCRWTCTPVQLLVNTLGEFSACSRRSRPSSRSRRWPSAS